MGARKGQLFLVSIVFLIGMIFIVQQALFQYSTIEMSKPFANRDAELFGNIIGVVNRTIVEAYYCNETKDSFGTRMDDIKTSFLEEHGREYSIEIKYDLNCTRWLSSSRAPLWLSVSLTSQGRNTRGTFSMYHAA
ncbi:MAG: hypothetical protein V1648_00390 [Candidatus Aenigmatarchaeota archaeon]